MLPSRFLSSRWSEPDRDPIHPDRDAVRTTGRFPPGSDERRRNRAFDQSVGGFGASGRHRRRAGERRRTADPGCHHRTDPGSCAPRHPRSRPQRFRRASRDPPCALRPSRVGTRRSLSPNAAAPRANERPRLRRRPRARPRHERTWAARSGQGRSRRSVAGTPRCRREDRSLRRWAPGAATAPAARPHRRRGGPVSKRTVGTRARTKTAPPLVASKLREAL